MVFPSGFIEPGQRWPTNTASRRLVSRAAERRKFCPLGVNIMLLMSTPETLIFIAAVVAARRDAVAADLIVDRERHTPIRDQGRGAAGQAGAQGGR